MFVFQGLRGSAAVGAMASDMQMFTEAAVDELWKQLEHGYDGEPMHNAGGSRVPVAWQRHPEIVQVGRGGCGEVFRWEREVRSSNVRTQYCVPSATIVVSSGTVRVWNFLLAIAGVVTCGDPYE